jgi:hypothetical protein
MARAKVIKVDVVCEEVVKGHIIWFGHLLTVSYEPAQISINEHNIPYKGLTNL